LTSNNSARPIQIVLKSIKVVKAESPSFTAAVDPESARNPLENVVVSKKAKKIEFHHRNILPIPHVPTKAFLNLTTFDPLSVAQAFYKAMQEFDLKQHAEKNETETEIDGNLMGEEEEAKDDDLQNTEGDESSKSSQVRNFSEEQENSKEVEKEDEEDLADEKKPPASQSFLASFLHVLQFCSLCSKQKIPPVQYSIVSNPIIDSWFNKLDSVKCSQVTAGSKRRNSVIIASPDSENFTMSPDPKMSWKDQYFIHTMLKIHDTMDENYKEKADKEPGFSRLEDHWENLIINASALPPYHCNCELFWLLPDSPSGVSIFIFPETKSSNASDIEKERLLALADKVNVSDVEKLAKQKLYLPNTIMDLVCMTQNLLAVIELCFGPSSHSAIFLKSWADHMYGNRIMYTTLYNSDPHFFGKVLYAIDNTLQVHWRSCSANDDRLSVNDRVLLLEDVQESILGFYFARNIPKSISDKIQNYLDQKDKDKNGKKGEGKFGGGGNGNIKFKGQGDGKGKQDVIHNSDKSHPNWRLKDGENFSKLFYHRQKDCPKTANGELICMKFLIRGLCVSSCSRAHSLSQEDSKRFDEFVSWCRVGGQKPDF